MRVTTTSVRVCYALPLTYSPLALTSGDGDSGRFAAQSKFLSSRSFWSFIRAGLSLTTFWTLTNTCNSNFVFVFISFSLNEKIICFIQLSLCSLYKINKFYMVHRRLSLRNNWPPELTILHPIAH